MDEYELKHDKYKKYCHSIDLHRADFTSVLDNSANVRIIEGKLLFIDDIKPCLIIMNAGAITSSNTPRGIDTAHFYWFDNDKRYHFYYLENSLYYP